MGMKNDLSFLIMDQMHLYEQQSTYTPNMPLRDLFYVTDLLQVYVKDKSVYSSKQIMLPTPHFIVFYNGNDMKQDRMVLRLSDSFSKTTEKACMELEAIVLNINYGKNKELMESCRPLMEYSYFVKKVKQYSLEMERVQAINAAVDECIQKNILKDLLIKNRAEVMDMLLTEYNEEKIMNLMENELEEMKLQLEQEQQKLKQEQSEKLEFKSQLEQEQQKLKQEQLKVQKLLKRLKELED